MKPESNQNQLVKPVQLNALITISVNNRISILMLMCSESIEFSMFLLGKSQELISFFRSTCLLRWKWLLGPEYGAGTTESSLKLNLKKKSEVIG